jgi:hypothetical protein
MQVFELHEQRTESMIITMFQRRNLVPVLGAGFSKGAHTQDASVPAAEEFRATMLDVLNQHVGEEAASLKEKKFAEVAEYFLNPQFVPTPVVKEVIRKYFTRVTLNGARKAFLACPWPYIYTLNIDDAIERNSDFKDKVIPNRRISTTARQLSCVYKVHGDAADELIYDEPSKIIFSTAQYVRSLTTNISMLNSLKTDLTEQNTLFVGCSLDQEIDLLYALAEYNNAFPEGRRSIFTTSKAPNRFEEAKLASHGINSVLLVRDYDAFYETIARWGKRAEEPAISLISPHLRGATLQRLDHDRIANLSFLLKESSGLKAGPDAVMPDFYVQRDIENAILRSTDVAPITLIRGRRYSGKTLLLQSLTLSAKSRKTYLFKSDTRVSYEVLKELAGVRNGLLLFDTNVLSPESAASLVTLVQTFMLNNCAVVVAANRTEPDVVGTLVRHVDDEADFELQPRLSRRECDDLNSKLDALGILRFNDRRTLLDNTFGLLEQYPQIKSELAKAQNLSEKEVAVLLVAAIADKAYSSLATALQIRTTEIFSLCEKLAPVIEVVETSRSELRDTNSRHKIVVNSKVGLSLQIRSITAERGFRWLSERISDTVRRLIDLPKFASIGHSMYMFDAINYVLAQTSDESEGTGYRPVVLSLYENLQPTLNSSADYWLQRAKAILNLENRKEALLEGIDYAMKAYHEAERERTIDNAEFTIALLYGKLCVATRFNDVEYTKAAIQCFSRAIRNYHRNPQYVQTMLEGNRFRKNSFHQLCDFLVGEVTAVSLLPLRDDIKFLLSVRQNWRSRV